MRYFFAAILCCISAFAQTPVDPSQIPAGKPEDKCSVEGTVINAATGEPIKKARVMLAPFSDGTKPYAATTDASGHFVIDEVDAGRFSLRSYRGGYTQPSTPHGSPKYSFRFTLEKGQKVTGIVLKLVPLGGIAGRVLDAEGEPVEGASVECMSMAYERGKRQLTDFERVDSDELGEFRIPRLAPGKYVIRATYEERWGEVQERPIRSSPAGQATQEVYIPTYYPSTMNPNSASDIEVSPGAQMSGITVTLMRSRTLRITGHVSSVGETLPTHTNILLSTIGDRNPRLGATADPNGDFQVDGVLPRSYILLAADMVEGTRYSARMPLEVQDTNIEGIKLVLHPPAEIQGNLIVEEKGDMKSKPW